MAQVTTLGLSGTPGRLRTITAKTQSTQVTPSSLDYWVPNGKPDYWVGNRKGDYWVPNGKPHYWVPGGDA